MNKYRVVFEIEDDEYPEPKIHAKNVEAKDAGEAQAKVWKKYPNVEIVRIDWISGKTDKPKISTKEDKEFMERLLSPSPYKEFNRRFRRF